MRTTSLIAIGALFVLAIGGCRTGNRPDTFSAWPSGKSPGEVGKRVAENFVGRPFLFQGNSRSKAIEYPEVCTWYGALEFSRVSGDTNLAAQLIEKFKTVQADTNRMPARAHVDDRVFGALPLEFYLQTRAPDFLELGLRFADLQWDHTSNDGVTSEARYWIDDMYMITLLQVQAYRCTDETRYIDRAARTMVAYLDRLQQPNGLFFHSTDSRFFWGRGNGWVAAGMTELLRSLPADHFRRPRILEGYRNMMQALQKYQRPDGLWGQLIDDTNAWSETSCSGMFAFAITTGAKYGWLDPSVYGPSARKAWLGLVERIDRDGNVRDVCVSTGKAHSEVGSDRERQRQFYLARPRNTGDLHGQAPILWTAAAMIVK